MTQHWEDVAKRPDVLRVLARGTVAGWLRQADEVWVLPVALGEKVHDPLEHAPLWVAEIRWASWEGWAPPEGTYGAWALINPTSTEAEEPPDPEEDPDDAKDPPYETLAAFDGEKETLQRVQAELRSVQAQRDKQDVELAQRMLPFLGNDYPLKDLPESVVWPRELEPRSTGLLLYEHRLLGLFIRPVPLPPRHNFWGEALGTARERLLKESTCTRVLALGVAHVPVEDVSELPADNWALDWSTVEGQVLEPFRVLGTEAPRVARANWLQRQVWDDAIQRGERFRGFRCPAHFRDIPGVWSLPRKEETLAQQPPQKETPAEGPKQAAPLRTLPTCFRWDRKLPSVGRVHAQLGHVTAYACILVCEEGGHGARLFVAPVRTLEKDTSLAKTHALDEAYKAIPGGLCILARGFTRTAKWGPEAVSIPRTAVPAGIEVDPTDTGAPYVNIAWHEDLGWRTAAWKWYDKLLADATYEKLHVGQQPRDAEGVAETPTVREMSVAVPVPAAGIADLGLGHAELRRILEASQAPGDTHHALLEAYDLLVFLDVLAAAEKEGVERSVLRQFTEQLPRRLKGFVAEHKEAQAFLATPPKRRQGPAQAFLRGNRETRNEAAEGLYRAGATQLRRTLRDLMLTLTGYSSAKEKLLNAVEMEAVFGLALSVLCEMGMGDTETGDEDTDAYWRHVVAHLSRELRVGGIEAAQRGLTSRLREVLSSVVVPLQALVETAPLALPEGTTIPLPTEAPAEVSEREGEK